MDAPGWDGVEIVYNAKEARETKKRTKHECAHIYPADFKNWHGTITLCPDCGTYWYLGYDLWTGESRWKRVHWWNIRSIRRIESGV